MKKIKKIRIKILNLKIYVLIISFSPLRIYLYNNGLTRFATEDYKRGDFDNVFIHLTNYSINKNNLNYKPNQNLSSLDWHKNKNLSGGEDMEENEDYDEECEFEEDYSKWSLFELRHFFKKIGKEKLQDFKKISAQVSDLSKVVVVELKKQGEQVNQLEDRAKQINDNAKNVKNETKETNEINESNIRKSICTILFLVAILAILIVIFRLTR